MKDDFNPDNEMMLYHAYAGLWGNMDYNIQVEQPPMTYAEFHAVPDKRQLIDDIKQRIAEGGR